jgi:ABC-type branched-subunit amino acid transport system ATPase component
MALADPELLIPDEPMQGWHPTETPETRRNPVRGLRPIPA